MTALFQCLDAILFSQRSPTASSRLDRPRGRGLGALSKQYCVQMLFSRGFFRGLIGIK